LSSLFEKKKCRKEVSDRMGRHLLGEIGNYLLASQDRRTA
jgi:hypothetical protein